MNLTSSIKGDLDKKKKKIKKKEENNNINIISPMRLLIVFNQNQNSY